MSTIVNRMMALELEFVNSETFGYIAWFDFPQEPENENDIVPQVQVSTLGLGSSEDKFLTWSLDELNYIKITGGGIQFDSNAWFRTESSRPTINEYGDPGEDETFTNCKVSFGKNTSDMELASYIPAGPNMDLGPETEINVWTEEEKRYEELRLIKEEYANNDTAFVIEHDNAIAFANPVTGRLIGSIDTVGEAFNWYGAFSLGSETEDSTFEVKRVDENKYNITLNADVNLIPELAFKYENVKSWSIYMDTDIYIKNNNDNGIIIKDTEVEFTGEIIYQNSPLLDYFYTQTILDNGQLDDRYYTETELDNGQLDDRYYTETELNTIFLDYSLITHTHDTYTRAEVDNIISTLNAGNREPIYYEFINDEWTEITLNITDENYDLQYENTNDGEYWLAELENNIYKNVSGSWNTIYNIDITYPDSLPHVLIIGETGITNGRLYEWNGSSWQFVKNESELTYTIVLHKSNISSPVEGDEFKISATKKFYKYEGGELITMDAPHPLYNSLPSQYNITNRVVKYSFT